ncbi:MAG: tetraacyldisaccharide-1-P 4'-kinase, partial [Bradymonadia bacterium]
GGRIAGPDWLAGRALRVLTGIARPASFIHLLERHGARIVERRVRADHHWFNAREIADLGSAWVTTAKDRARLPVDCPINTLHIGLRLESGSLDALIDAVSCGRRGGG